MSNLKFFKRNKNQPIEAPNAVDRPKHVPNYVSMGITPQVNDGRVEPRVTMHAPLDAPESQIHLQQEEEKKAARYKQIFKEISSSPDSFSLEREMEEFGKLNMSQGMIDNNPRFDSAEDIEMEPENTFNIAATPISSVAAPTVTATVAPPMTVKVVTESVPPPYVLDEPLEDDMAAVLSELNNDDHILFLDYEPLCVGAKEEVEKMATNLAFGRLVDFGVVDIERLLILKRVEVKMGLFVG